MNSLKSVLFIAGLSLAAAALAAETADSQPSSPSLTPALAPTLNIGDQAPPLPVMAWIKGKPVTRFEPGHVYIVDFWATWCGVCIEGMPHLTELQKKYDGRLTVIGVNARETTHQDGPVDPTVVKATVEKSARKLAARMQYTIAMDHPVDQPVFDTWQNASGCIYEPNAFIVDGKGRIVWVGTPSGKWKEKFDAAVEAALNGTSDLDAARAIQEEQFGTQMVSSRFYRKFQLLLRTDEAAAMNYANEGAQDSKLRTALGVGNDVTYWSTIGLAMATEDTLSVNVYRMAAGYVEQFTAARPEIPAPWLGLAGLYYRIGENGKGAAAQATAFGIFRQTGIPENQLAELERRLMRLKNGAAAG